MRVTLDLFVRILFLFGFCYAQSTDNMAEEEHCRMDKLQLHRIMNTIEELKASLSVQITQIGNRLDEIEDKVDRLQG